MGKQATNKNEKATVKSASIIKKIRESSGFIVIVFSVFYGYYDGDS